MLPAAVDGSELGLSLFAVVENAHNNALGREGLKRLDARGSGETGRGAGCRGAALLDGIVLLGEVFRVSLAGSLRLIEQPGAGPLVEPGAAAAPERGVAAGSDDGGFTGAVGFAGGGLVGAQFSLDAAALVAAFTGKVRGSVGEFVRIQPKLRLGDVEVVALLRGDAGVLRGGVKLVWHESYRR